MVFLNNLNGEGGIKFGEPDGRGRAEMVHQPNAFTYPLDSYLRPPTPFSDARETKIQTVTHEGESTISNLDVLKKAENLLRDVELQWQSLPLKPELSPKSSPKSIDESESDHYAQKLVESEFYKSSCKNKKPEEQKHPVLTSDFNIHPHCPIPHCCCRKSWQGSSREENVQYNYNFVNLDRQKSHYEIRRDLLKRYYNTTVSVNPPPKKHPETEACIHCFPPKKKEEITETRKHSHGDGCSCHFNKAPDVFNRSSKRKVHHVKLPKDHLSSRIHSHMRYMQPSETPGQLSRESSHVVSPTSQDDKQSFLTINPSSCNSPLIRGRTTSSPNLKGDHYYFENQESEKKPREFQNQAPEPQHNPQREVTQETKKDSYESVRPVLQQKQNYKSSKTKECTITATKNKDEPLKFDSGTNTEPQQTRCNVGTLKVVSQQTDICQEEYPGVLHSGRVIQVQELPKMSIRPQLSKHMGPSISIVHSETHKTESVKNIALINVVHSKKSKPSKKNLVVTPVNSDSLPSSNESREESSPEKSLHDVAVTFSKKLNSASGIKTDTLKIALDSLVENVNDLYEVKKAEFQKAQDRIDQIEGRAEEHTTKMKLVAEILAGEMESMDDQNEDHYRRLSQIISHLALDIKTSKTEKTCSQENPQRPLQQESAPNKDKRHVLKRHQGSMSHLGGDLSRNHVVHKAGPSKLSSEGRRTDEKYKHVEAFLQSQEDLKESSSSKSKKSKVNKMEQKTLETKQVPSKLSNRHRLYTKSDVSPETKIVESKSRNKGKACHREKSDIKMRILEKAYKIPSDQDENDIVSLSSFSSEKTELQSEEKLDLNKTYLIHQGNVTPDKKFDSTQESSNREDSEAAYEDDWEAEEGDLEPKDRPEIKAGGSKIASQTQAPSDDTTRTIIFDDPSESQRTKSQNKINLELKPSASEKIIVKEQRNKPRHGDAVNFINSGLQVKLPQENAQPAVNYNLGEITAEQVPKTTFCDSVKDKVDIDIQNDFKPPETGANDLQIPVFRNQQVESFQTIDKSTVNCKDQVLKMNNSTKETFLELRLPNSQNPYESVVTVHSSDTDKEIRLFFGSTKHDVAQMGNIQSMTPRSESKNLAIESTLKTDEYDERMDKTRKEFQNIPKNNWKENKSTMTQKDESSEAAEAKKESKFLDSLTSTLLKDIFEDKINEIFDKYKESKSKGNEHGCHYAPVCNCAPSNTGFCHHRFFHHLEGPTLQLKKPSCSVSTQIAEGPEKLVSPNVTLHMARENVPTASANPLGPQVGSKQFRETDNVLFDQKNRNSFQETRQNKPLENHETYNRESKCVQTESEISPTPYQLEEVIVPSKRLLPLPEEALDIESNISPACELKNGKPVSVEFKEEKKSTCNGGALSEEIKSREMHSNNLLSNMSADNYTKSKGNESTQKKLKNVDDNCSTSTIDKEYTRANDSRKESSGHSNIGPELQRNHHEDKISYNNLEKLLPLPSEINFTLQASKYENDIQNGQQSSNHMSLPMEAKCASYSDMQVKGPSPSTQEGISLKPKTSNSDTSLSGSAGVPYYNSDEMSDGEIGYVYTSHTYSSGEIKPRTKDNDDLSNSIFEEELNEQSESSRHGKRHTNESNIIEDVNVNKTKCLSMLIIRNESLKENLAGIELKSLSPYADCKSVNTSHDGVGHDKFEGKQRCKLSTAESDSQEERREYTQSSSNESTSTGELKNQIDTESDTASDVYVPDLVNLLHKCETLSSSDSSKHSATKSLSTETLPTTQRKTHPPSESSSHIE